MNKEYDVIVIGGGIAGCSAALAARRHGKSVLVLEKLITIGGLATAGQIVIYLPLDDGFGRQVIGGISEELLRLSSKYAYYAGDFSKWKEEGKRYECKFNGPAFSLALEDLLLSEGVDILYDTLFVGSDINGRSCKGVYIENKTGHSMISCKAVVDASGDADLFIRSGEPWKKAPNSLAIWLYNAGSSDYGYQRRGGSDAPGLKLVSLGKIDITQEMQRIETPYYGDCAENITRFVIDGHKRLLSHMKEDSSFVPASLPSIAQIRMARRICGMYLLSDKDAGVHFEDNIGGTGDWRKPGPIYEIPFRTLMTEDLENVLCSGRCISTDGEAWEILRCIPQAALTGQAAGTAIALSIDRKSSVQKLDVRELRGILRSDGVILDINAKKEAER